MSTESHQVTRSSGRQNQDELARQDIEAILANLNSLELMVTASIARLREDIMMTAVHLG